MRTKNVVKNSFYSIVSYLIIFILGLINRRIFLEYLSIEILGYEGLFSNIFALLSIAELGVGTVITYSLYQEIASNNKKQIAKLMMMYKYMYRIIGFFITFVGIFLFPFLGCIITDNGINWDFIRIIYFLQLISMVSTYFLSFRRLLYVTDQKIYICIKVDTIINIITQLIKILVLLLFRNYIAYLCITIFGNVLANSIIAHMCNKDYPYAKYANINKQDFIERRFFKDIKNFLIHRLSYIVYGGVSNIIISVNMGIQYVGLVSNYMLLKNQIENLLYKVIEPMNSSIGNMVHSEDEKKRKDIFFAFDLGSFFLGAFVSISCMTLYQPLIELWLGNQFLLSEIFVLLLSINLYISWTHIAVSIHRGVFGEFEKDRIFMILSAIVNLICSIIFVQIWGLSGVILGMIIGNIIIIYGRIWFVFKIYLKESHVIYIKKQIKLFFFAVFEGMLIYCLSSFFSNAILGFIGKVMICLIIPNTLNILIFHKNEHFKLAVGYFYQAMLIIRDSTSTLGKNRKFIEGLKDGNKN